MTVPGEGKKIVGAIEANKAPPETAEAKQPGDGARATKTRPANAKTGQDNIALRLGMVLQLTRRARRADRNELPFVMVNETRQFIAYRQAALWNADRGGAKLAALSGLAAPDRNSPYVMWINRFARWRLRRAGQDGTECFSLSELAASEGAPAWLGEWREWLPEHGMSAALIGPGGWACGYLCLFRDAAFTEGDAGLFSHLAEAYGDSMGVAQMRPRRRPGISLWRIATAVFAVLLVAAMFVPQPQTTMAKAEVTARRPAIVRAGVEGVVENFLVEPNQRVAEGEPLLRLEDTQLRTRLAVALKAEEMARVELRQLQQAALHDGKSKARLPLAQGRVEQLAAETAYVRSLLDRVVAVSPLDGVALVDNPDEWRGRPVGLGQRIMMVADPSDVILDIFLPVGEALPIAPGDELQFFPNVAPASPVRARIVFVSYRAADTPGVGMAFRLRAEFSDGEHPMLGLRGTARIAGKPMPLGLILLRRPIMAVRQWLGM